MKYLAPTIVLAASIGLMSCTKDQVQSSTANETGYTVQMKAAESSNKAEAFSLNSAWVTVTEIELEREGDSSDSDIDISGMYRVDLLTGLSTPEMPVAEVEAGTYSELEITIGSEDFNTTAFYLEGTYENSLGVAMNVEIEIAGEFELEIEHESGIEIRQSDVRELVVNMDVNTVLRGMDMSSASVNADGVIVISGQQNTDLYAQIISALSAQFEIED